MGHRTLAFVIGVATTLSAQTASALGLGEIRLNSTLNQPLDAEIRLLQVRDLSEQEILVGLASLEDFRRVGVDRPYFLSDLKFSVDLNDPDGPVVQIKSNQPVREPYLNFVVQAQWPSGRLLREYTLLMDLPTFADEQQAQSVQAPQQQSQQPAQSSRGQGQQRQQPRQQQAEQQQEQPAQRGTRQGGSTYGPVSASDTLWEIAASNRPDNSISVQQSMIAIQRANPGAFINNNINRLREGQVLRIPGREEMTELTAREAINEVAYQNQSWSGAGDSSAQQAQLEGSRSYSATRQESAQPEGRVKLSSPQETSPSAEGRGTGSGGGNTEALENELAATLEELDKARSENEELRSRLETLEEQIQTMERLVDVSSEEMRALQLASQQAREGANGQGGGADDSAQADTEGAAQGGADSGEADAGERSADDSGAPSAPGAATEAPAQQQAQAESQDQTQTPAETEATTGSQAQERQSAPDPTRVVRSAPHEDKSFVNLLMDNLIWIGFGLLALLGGLLLFLKGRNKDEDEEFDDFFAESESDNYDEFANVEEDDHADITPVAGAVAADDAEDAETEELAEERAAEQETEDAVAEAGIYIALAKYDQAEEILLRALEKDPQDTEARLKLMEMYATQQDLENFDPHYAKLRVLDDREANARAEELRDRIPGAQAFDDSQFDTSDFAALVAAGGVAAGAGYAAASEEQSLDRDFDLSNFDEESVGASNQVDEDINNDLNDLDDLTDFDLDLDLGDATDDETIETEADSDSIDFDFELDIEDESGATEEVAEAGDVDDEFAFELGLDDAVTENEQDKTAATDDLAALEFDLGDDLKGGHSGDEAGADEDADAFDFDFDLSDELKADTSSATEETLALHDQEEANTVSADDAGDGALDLPEALGMDEPETLEDAVEENFATTPAPRLDEDNQEDELDIDADMDLSALDEELDAMTSGFDSDATVDAEDTALEEPAASEEEPSAEGEEPLALEEESSLVEDEISASSALEQSHDELLTTFEQPEPSSPVMEDPATELQEAITEVDEPFAVSDADDLALSADSASGDEELVSMDEPLTDFDELDTLLDEEPEDNDSESAPAWQSDLEALDTEVDASETEADDAELAMVSRGAEEDSAEYGVPVEEEGAEGATEGADTASSEDEMADTLASGEAPLDYLEQVEENTDAADEDAPESEPFSLPESATLDDVVEEEESAAEVGAEASGMDFESLFSSDSEFDLDDLDVESEDDSEFGFLNDSDETATKLDLARAYIDMGDTEGAKDILGEILQEGNDNQRKEAQELMERV